MDRYNLNFGFSKVERRFCCGGTREKHKLISDGFNHKELNFNYEKINKSGSKKETKEIIIFNY
mgnify:CR=1 FL=1